MRRALVPFALWIVVSPSVRADPLAELRAVLETLRATTPVTASAVVRIESVSDDDGTTQKEEGEVMVELEQGMAGLAIRYPAALLERLEREAKGRRADPDRPSPARSAVRELDAVLATALLDHAPVLLGRLEQADLLEQKSATFEGAPARLLVIRPQTRIPAAARKRVKAADFALRVWTRADGQPLAAELTEKIHARVLLLNFHHEGKTTWRFTRAGDRLVAHHYREETSDQGLGQSSRRAVEVRLTPAAN